MQKQEGYVVDSDPITLTKEHHLNLYLRERNKYIHTYIYN